MLTAGLASCLLFSACGDDFIYEHSVEIPGQEWRYGNLIAFEFEIPDTNLRYDLLLTVEHAGDYGFQNLYTQFHTEFPDGKTESQVVSLELANKTGRWNGTCSGNDCEVEIPLQTRAIFRETGTHRLLVEQYMRKDPLPGIEGMTLRIKPAGLP